MPGVPSEPEGRARRVLQNLGPWIVAAIALAIIFTRYSPRLIVVELGRGNSLLAAGCAFALIALAIFPVVAGDRVVVTVAAGAIRFVDILRARAACASLQVIHYTANHGTYGLWIARRTGASAATASGAVLYIVASELFAVSFVAAVATTLGGPTVGIEQVRRVSIGVSSSILLVMLLAASRPQAKGRQLFDAWRCISRAGVLTLTSLRVVQIALVVVFAWLGARAFGLHVPLAAMAATLPIILLVGSLPVNVAGFGAVQGAWLLLEPWAESGEQVLAFSLVWQLLCGAAMVLRGLPFVKRTIGELAAGVPAELS